MIQNYIQYIILDLQFIMPQILARDLSACHFCDRGKIRRYRRTRRCDPTRRARNEGVAIRVSWSVEEPLCSSIIVNPNKRERARAKLRVGHKAAWRRTVKNGAWHSWPSLSSGFWFRPTAGRFVLRRDTRPPLCSLVRWVRGHRGSGQDSS